MENDTLNQNISTPITTLPPEQKPKMKLWKKVLLTLVVLIVVIGVGIYFLPQILSITHPGDAALIDSSQLILQKVSVPDTDNGFYDLNKITKEMINVPINDQKPPFDIEYTDST